MSVQLKSIRKMTALRLALEANRDTALKATRMDQNISNFSERALAAASLCEV
jgi:hypothetical protein